MQAYLGIDVGSVSTNLVVWGENDEVMTSLYLRTQGDPIRAVQAGLAQVKEETPAGVHIAGVGTTGSGRQLAAAMVGADTVKNEITAHAVAALSEVPAVQTVLEIGGQDSKIIILRHGVVVDFAMNTVCAAGTGSFLDRQAARLNVPIEEFGNLAVQATNPVRIAGRCAVFAESDMIHKQQLGHRVEDIVAGLCQALVRNYLNNVAKGKEIRPPILFQGGVAANIGMRRAFEEALGQEVQVPAHHAVMGALGAARLARKAVAGGRPSCFQGFEVSKWRFQVTSQSCSGCANQCEVVEIGAEGRVLARWGDRCGRWSNLAGEAAGR
ncbi:MAG TPA: 2-hydroxyglutaryl-CoA dehydratase [Firmicutes bacterium]|nr:2-hydroxyglutaryl-CoA dehydratase [Bacillota bacterium]